MPAKSTLVLGLAALVHGQVVPQAGCGNAFVGSFLYVAISFQRLNRIRNILLRWGLPSSSVRSAMFIARNTPNKHKLR
jgi:hypothetical protein